jgi:hypothetical protein
MNAIMTTPFNTATPEIAQHGVQDLYGAETLKQLQGMPDSRVVTASLPRSSIRRFGYARWFSAPA